MGSVVRSLLVVCAILQLNLGAEAVHDELGKLHDEFAMLGVSAEAVPPKVHRGNKTMMMTIPTTKATDVARDGGMYRFLSAKEMDARCPFGCYHHLGPNDGRPLTEEEAKAFLQDFPIDGEKPRLQSGEAAHEPGSLAENGSGWPALRKHLFGGGFDFQTCDDLKEIGNGAFGMVHSATCDSDGKKVKVAIKTPINGRNYRDGCMLLQKEIKVMRAIKAETTPENRIGEVTVNMLGYSDFPFPLRMALEFATNGDLTHGIKELTMNKGCTWKLLLDICTAFVALPELVHRDMKTDNFLVFAKDGEIQFKVADFGLATMDSSTMPGAGTPGYAALEVMDGKDGGHPGDVFSAAVTVLEMIMGEGRDHAAFYMAMNYCKYQTQKSECSVEAATSSLKNVAEEFIQRKWGNGVGIAKFAMNIVNVVAKGRFGNSPETDAMMAVLSGMLRDNPKQRYPFAKVLAHAKSALQDTTASASCRSPFS